MNAGYILRLLTVLRRLQKFVYRHDPDPPKVALDKQLAFCYTNFKDENLMFTTEPDSQPRLYIVDFQHASYLPLSFLTYAILVPNSRWILCSWITKELGTFLPEYNIAVMLQLSHISQICWS